MKKIDVVRSKILGKEGISNLGPLEELIYDKGYFSNDPNFLSYVEDTLDGVASRYVRGIYQTSFFAHNNKRTYGYFIPFSAVTFLKEEQTKEKTYRPFNTIDDFINNNVFLGVGSKVHYRCKQTSIETNTAFMGYSSRNDILHNVFFGPHVYSPEALLKMYEYEYEGKWYPFGVEE